MCNDRVLPGQPWVATKDCNSCRSPLFLFFLFPDGKVTRELFFRSLYFHNHVVVYSLLFPGVSVGNASSHREKRRRFSFPRKPLLPGWHGRNSHKSSLTDRTPSLLSALMFYDLTLSFPSFFYFSLPRLSVQPPILLTSLTLPSLPPSFIFSLALLSLPPTPLFSPRYVAIFFFSAWRTPTSFNSIPLALLSLSRQIIDLATAADIDAPPEESFSGEENVRPVFSVKRKTALPGRRPNSLYGILEPDDRAFFFSPFFGYFSERFSFLFTHLRQ